MLLTHVSGGAELASTSSGQQTNGTAEAKALQAKSKPKKRNNRNLGDLGVEEHVRGVPRHTHQMNSICRGKTLRWARRSSRSLAYNIVSSVIIPRRSETTSPSGALSLLRGVQAMPNRRKLHAWLAGRLTPAEGVPSRIYVLSVAAWLDCDGSILDQ